MTDTDGVDTFPKLLQRHAQQRGGHPAFREKTRGIWRTTSWRELAEETRAIAAGLIDLGLARGAHVAFVGDNRPRLYVAMCAAQWLGAVAVPLYQDGSAAEMIDALQGANVTHVFAENQEQVDKLLSILPQCPSIKWIVYDKDRGMRHYAQPQLVSYSSLLQKGRDASASRQESLRTELARGNGQDIAFLFFTSGTTGPAKGVVLDYASLIDRARTLAAVDGVTDADVAMAYLPPGWIGQNLFGYVQPMVVGCCVCCPESSDTMLADMREIGPTYFLATPSVLKALMTQVSMRIEDTGGFNRALYLRGMEAMRRINASAQAGTPVSSADRFMAAMCNALIFGPLRDVLGMSRVRVAYSAGDMVDPDLIAYFRALGVNLKQLYGSTETGFIVAVPRNGEVKPDTVGPVAQGVELSFGPDKEILVRSPGLFKAYYGDAEATGQAKGGDGWFRTGDAGYLGPDGHLRIIDRMKYVGALKDGSPFAPRVIESKLRFSIYIREAVVFGDGRDRASALIDIDTAAVGRWADANVISYTGHADLASRDEVYALVAGCIGAVNAALANDPVLRGSQIHRFTITQKEIGADDGLLTRTGKLRRARIAEHYMPVVEAIYGGQSHVTLGAAYGPEGVHEVNLKIGETSAAPAAQNRRAA
jgi:long-chain acyl-CoA synthetase